MARARGREVEDPDEVAAEAVVAHLLFHVFGEDGPKAGCEICAEVEENKLPRQWHG